eukprot:CAMPEP_0184477906 /NCGR_PEP_ID=MMETSP0113_2-20130426/41_1 /TAXON_ID=91329 /ORGANISM="Norrisiella sphaerica, Strain BC52" /LENGTH=262 /DNA_ID=CAMNT_0026855513 /DNA_START=45 /DNA_END=833 /DNA_ORIENTATION=-
MAGLTLTIALLLGGASANESNRGAAAAPVLRSPMKLKQSLEEENSRLIQQKEAGCSNESVAKVSSHLSRRLSYYKVAGIFDKGGGSRWRRWVRTFRKLVFRATVVSVALSIARRKGLLKVNVHNFYPQLHKPVTRFLEVGDSIVDAGEEILGLVHSGRDERDRYLLPYASATAPTSDKRLAQIAGKLGGIVDTIDSAAGEALEGAVSGINSFWKELQASKLDQPELTKAPDRYDRPISTHLLTTATTSTSPSYERGEVYVLN